MQQIHSHTALRGLAALGVVYGHYSYVFGRDIQGMNFFIPRTHLGVDMFFILSGYILYRVYAATFERQITVKNWAQFQIRRLARIYPLHIATLLMVIALIRFKVDPASYDVLLMNLTLIHAWGFTDRFEFNAPSWSISCEFMAYLVFPFMAVLIKDRVGTLAVFIGALTAYMALWQYGHGSLDLEEIGPVHGILRAVGGFPLGVLLAKMQVNTSPRAEAAKPALQWIGLLAFVDCILLQLPDMAYIPAFAILIYATASDRGPLVRVLNNPVLTGFGEISYSIYLIQWPIMLALFSIRPKLAEHMGPVGVDMASLAFFVVTLLGLSLLSWRYFERPFIRWGRAVSSGMARPQQKAA